MDSSNGSFIKCSPLISRTSPAQILVKLKIEKIPPCFNNQKPVFMQAL